MRDIMNSIRLPLLSVATLSTAIAMVVAGTSVGFAEEDPKSASDAIAAPIKVPGVFQSVNEVEVSAGNEHLTELKIERVVPSGTTVTKGQVLVWFETENLSRKLRDAETDLQLAKLTLEADEFAHTQFLERLKLDRAKAKRTRDAAQQDYDNYQKVDRERTIKQAHFSLDSSKFSLESATEEYRQLEQMYKEDDLTEESEEIVLRRAKRSMESAAFSLEGREIQTERTLKQGVPRTDKNQEDTFTRAIMDYEKTMRDLAIDEQKRKIELKRKQQKFAEQQEKFQEMKAERKRVVVRSEIDGIFLHGVLTRGKIGPKPVTIKKGDSATGKQVLGVVVDPTRLQVRADVPEDSIGVVQKGATCKVRPKGLKDVSVNGTVKSVGAVAFINGKHDCVVALRGKVAPTIMPGMNCDLIFTLPETDKAE